MSTEHTALPSDEGTGAPTHTQQKEGATTNSTVPGEGVTLSQEQKDAIELIVSTEKPVVILTGQAGSGKSTIINALKARGSWKVSATTGKAAMHVGGSTVDMLFCFSRRDWTIWSYSYLEKIMTDIPDDIIIDEASMIGKHMGNRIIKTAREYRKKLLLVGDWAQASPVKDDLILDSEILDDYEFIKLTENHRQGEGVFMEVLNKVREGTVDDQVDEVFQERTCQVPPDDDRYIRMYATNAKTDAYNNARLWRHVSDTGTGHFVIYAFFEDRRPKKKREASPREERFRQKVLEAAPFGHGEPLAVGCRVLLTVNSKPGGAYVNGDTGTLTGALAEDGRDLESCIAEHAENGRPYRISELRVLLDRTNKDVRVIMMERDVEDPMGRYVQHRVSGFPVRLGYACTVHKAQGMTVGKAWFDMSSLGKFPDNASRHGLAYVALSRARTLEGLLIKDWDPSLVYCNDQIKPLL